MMPSGTSASCHVAYCFDGAYALLTGISLTSLLHNNPGPAFHIHCLVRDVSIDDRTRLLTTAKRYGAVLEFIELDSTVLQGLPVEGHLSSPMIYARLLLPELLPADLGRVLYLDSDTVVLQSLTELFDLDMGEHCIAAVPDAAHVAMGQRFGFPPEAYFNAGVQLMNLPRWRAESLGRRCLESLQDESAWPRFQALDQDALNLQVKGDYLRLPARYNHGQYHKGEATVLGSPIRFSSAGNTTKIIQFLGRIKPTMACYQGPGLAEFERYQAASEWHDVAPLPPMQVTDLTDLADKLCAEGRSEDAVAHLKQGLFTLADRIAKESRA